MGRSLHHDVADNVLVLIPGQYTEILVNIDNTGNRNLSWRLEVKGDFPVEWCLNPQLADEIHPNEQFQSQIRFQIPTEFIEQAELSFEQPCLTLNYQAEISLYSLENEHAQLAGDRTFQLWVRPDCLYLNFVPEIFQASDFTGRFLTIFEQSFEPTVQSFEVFWAYLDPLTAPKALLPFLAEWVGWILNPQWTLRQQRRLLRNAMRLYRWRGTRWGLLAYLHLYTNLPLQEKDIPDELRAALLLDDSDVAETEKRISVVENHTAGFVLGHAEFHQSPMFGGGRPYHFTVTLRPDAADALDRDLVQQIIEQVKPAFCTYDLWIINASG